MATVQQLAFQGVASTPGAFSLSRSRADVGKVKLPPVQVFDLQRLPSIEREEVIREYFSPSPSPNPRPRPPFGRRRVRAQTEEAVKVAEEFSLKDLEIEDDSKKLEPEQERDFTGTPYIPIYVMLPLGTINKDNEVEGYEDLKRKFEKLKRGGVDGVMVDCWWGLVEAKAPQHYEWSGYHSLFTLARECGLQLQVVMSFHQCGGNVGDDVFIPLPQWVLDIGKKNPDIFFTDKHGVRNLECLSWGVDKVRCLGGRSGLEVYYDYMRSFRQAMSEFFLDGTITEIEVGLGACGELRYPSYPETRGWKYPGIGEFQCYDKYLLEDLQKAAEARGHSHWAQPPDNAGEYNSRPQDTGFFRDGGDYDSYYGRFFLKWYSNVLIEHGDRVLTFANIAFEGVKIAAKVSGIHWWYKTASHAAELAAGFYNPSNRDGYAAIAKMMAKHDASFNFTCVELRTLHQAKGHPEAFADPEGLVWQVLNAAWDAGISVAAGNALGCFDRQGYNQVLENAKPQRDPDGRHLIAFTYLRLNDELMKEHNFKEFSRFVKRLHGEPCPFLWNNSSLNYGELMRGRESTATSRPSGDASLMFSANEQSETCPLNPSVATVPVACAPSSSQCEEDLQEETSCPKLDPQHKIFLSHSRAQKPFVEQLCTDLETLNHFPFFDQRDGSLPKGESFEELIFKAAKECKVAVIVLSPEYLSSEWPMMELVEFVRAKGSTNPKLKLFPIFFKASVGDLSDKSIEKRWKPKWKKLGQLDRMAEWAAAVRELRGVNGPRFEQFGRSEVKYRAGIVNQIFSLVPPELLFDTSKIVGGDRICMELKGKFVRHSGTSADVLGVYGMGGLGKTTMSKSLCNHFSQLYSGKVCYIDMKVEAKALERQQMVMRKLLRCGKMLLKRQCDISEGWALLRERMKEHPVFLVIDNVQADEVSKEEAREYVNVKYNLSSKILVISRSSDVVADVLGGSDYCHQMPFMTSVEAGVVFLQHVDPSMAYSSLTREERTVILRCIKPARFSDGGNRQCYQPMALVALGVRFRGKGWKRGDVLLWEERLPDNEKVKSTESLMFV